MPEHTPGPWALRGFNTANEVCGIMSGTVDERGHHVNSKQVLPFFGCDPKGMHHQRHMADKALIESAPDLLAALVDMVEAYDDPDYDSEPACLTAAKQAIAKAKGETP